MMHLAMRRRRSMPSDFPCDIIGPMFYETTSSKNRLPITPGKAMPNDKPGLGVELDDAKVEKYRVK